MDKLVRLYIVRHGETEFNLERRAQGWCDSPLTKSGKDIAAKLGAGLSKIDFTGAYSSDLGRAKESAAIILKNAGKNINLNIDPGLKERGMGKLEGNIIGHGPWAGAEEKAALDGFADSLDIKELSRLYEAMTEEGGIEPLDIFKSRLLSALNRICGEAPVGRSDILVVSHGLAILGMIYAITENKYVPMFIKNASVTLIEYTQGRYNIKKVNDLSYIGE